MTRRAARFALLCAAAVLSACDSDPERPRVLVFGIDGAGYDLTRQLMDRGELPNLARLRERGAFGPLLSIEPMVSPALWTTAATGKRRASHGILGFTAEGEGSSRQELHTSHLLRTRRIWDVVGDAGFRVGIVNWWVTWPVTPVNGFLVSNLWPTSENMIRELQRKDRGLPGDVPLVEAHYSSTYPDELLVEIARFIVEDEDIAAEELEALQLSRENYEFIWDLPEMKSRAAAGLHLYETRRPDFFMIYFWILDHVEHQYFPQSNLGPVRRVFTRLDAILGRFLELAGEDAIIVVLSDHGFRALRTPRGVLAEHDREGILFASGPPFRDGLKLKDAQIRMGIEDVTPTILAALGLPVARDLDGVVVPGLFREGFFEAQPVRSVASFDAEPLPRPRADGSTPFEAELKERLRALGYLDAEGGAP